MYFPCGKHRKRLEEFLTPSRRFPLICTMKNRNCKKYVSAGTDTYTPWGSETPIECMLVKEEGNASYSKLPFNSIGGFQTNHFDTID